jgi:hypothetical protein
MEMELGCGVMGFKNKKEETKIILVNDNFLF